MRLWHRIASRTDVYLIQYSTVVREAGFAPDALRAIHKAENFGAGRGGRLFRPSQPLRARSTTNKVRLCSGAGQICRPPRFPP
jgi:hypothetical protein